MSRLATAVLGSTAWPEGYAVMHPSTDPLIWPTLHPAMAPVLLGALAPLALTAAPDGGRP